MDRSAEIRKQARPALREIMKLGKWDSIHVAEENGEVVVFATIKKDPIKKFLLDVGLMKKPELPERIEGVRCKLVVALRETGRK